MPGSCSIFCLRGCLRQSGDGGRWRRGGGGFTLVELLVILAVITILVALLLPVVQQTRWQARSVRCLNNLRQVSIGLLNYAQAHGGYFPPADGPDKWFDLPRLGQFLANAPSLASDAANTVYVCPEDDNSIRSYALNVWAASRIPQGLLSAIPQRGKPFRLGAAQADRLILVTEAHSGFTAASMFGLTQTSDWTASDKIGMYGLTPGARFGGGGGISPPLSSALVGLRFAPQITELPYYRHRRPGQSDLGAVHIAFLDAHAAGFRQAELVEIDTGRSTLEALWSPLDYQLNPPE